MREIWKNVDKRTIAKSLVERKISTEMSASVYKSEGPLRTWVRGPSGLPLQFRDWIGDLGNPGPQ
jgi:hypothetical protein